MANFTGTSGLAKVGATSVAITKWTLDLETEKAENTSTASAGWQSLIAGGISKGMGDIEFYFDSVNQSANLFPLTNSIVAFLLDVGNSDTQFSFNGMILKYSTDNEIGKTIKCKGSFETSGVVTLVSGS